MIAALVALICATAVLAVVFVIEAKAAHEERRGERDRLGTLEQQNKDLQRQVEDTDRAATEKINDANEAAAVQVANMVVERDALYEKVERHDAVVATVCVPRGTTYGLEGNRLRVSLRMKAVAPFQVEAVKVSMRGDLYIAGSVVGVFDVTNYPLAPSCGGRFEAPLERSGFVEDDVNWTDSGRLRSGAIGFDVSGVLTLAGPWPDGIQEVRFSDYVLVPFKR